MELFASNTHYLSRNPIVVSIHGSETTFVYCVCKATDASVVYTGIVHLLQSFNINVGQIVLSELFDGISAPTRYYIADQQNINVSLYDFWVYPGGASQQTIDLLGYYDGAEGNYDIFKTKLFNYNQQFFLTCRTAGNLIAIPENELADFYFYGNGNTLRFKTTDGALLQTIETSLNTTYSFNIKALLYSSLRTSVYREVDVFYLQNNVENYSCSIIVTECTQPAKAILEFANGFEKYERFALSEEIEFTPLFSEKKTTNSYRYGKELKRQSERSFTCKYTTRAIYTTEERRMFLISLLSSHTVYLIVPSLETGYRTPCNVECNEELLSVTDGQPIAVTLTIELQTTEPTYTPFVKPDDIIQSTLTNSKGTYITGSNRVPIVQY